MLVKNIQINKYGDKVELSGMVDDFKLWYRFPNKYKLQANGDPFLAAALLTAMYKKEPLIIDSSFPVSPRLLDGAKTIQEVFHSWSSSFGKKMHIIDISASVQPSQFKCNTSGSFFSGGVDGFYTFLKNVDKIDVLLFAKGIDMQLDNDELYKTALLRNQKFLEQYNKTILPFETNVRFLGHELANLSWSICFPGGLASIALALGIRTCYIAGGYTHRHILGNPSNAFTDPLWSTEATSIIHHGAEKYRHEKLKYISSIDGVLDVLRVCWQDKGYNCGVCDKCIRTMIALKLLDITCPNFPPLKSNKAINQQRIESIEDYVFLLDNLELAEKVKNQNIAKSLRKCLNRYELKKILLKLDSIIMGGRFKNLYKSRTA